MNTDKLIQRYEHIHGYEWTVRKTGEHKSIDRGTIDRVDTDRQRNRNK